MKHANRLSTVLIGAAAIAAAVGLSGAARAQVNLSFASIVGPTAFLDVEILTPWLNDITASANGAVTFRVLPAASAAAPADVFDAVEAGLVDIGWSVMSYTAGRFPAASVVDLPLMADDAEEASIALWHLYDRGLLDGLDGVKVLGIFTSDILRLHHVGAVDGLAGFRGARVRAAGQDISATLETLGAVPVGLPITSVAESLARHVIEGAAADWQALDGWQIIDVLSTHVDVPLGATGIFLVMNQNTWDRLTPEVQAAFEAHSYLAFSERWGGRLAERARELRDQIAALDGHTVLVPSEAELAAFRAGAEQVVANWAARTPNGEAVIAALREEIARFRAGQ